MNINEVRIKQWKNVITPKNTPKGKTKIKPKDKMRKKNTPTRTQRVIH